MRLIFLFLNKPGTQQEGADGDNDDSGAIHEKLKRMFGGDADFRFPISDFYLWHGVVAATAPWMTTADSFYCEITANERAVRANGFHGVLRTGGGEAAATGGAKEKKLRGRNRPAIRTEGEHQDMLGWIHGCFSKPARRSVVK